MKKFSFIIIVLFFLVIVLKTVLVTLGIIHDGPMQGCGVSSDGTIYIGYRDSIEAFRNQSLVFSFKPPTSRNYSFFIENDKLIIGLSTGGAKEYNTKGDLVGDSELSYNAVKSLAKKSEYQTKSGDRYELKKSAGIKRFEIRCNGEAVFKESVLDYLFNGFSFWLIFIFAFFNMTIWVLIAVGQIASND